MGAAITTNTEQPRIYVACLAAYNNGYLHGAWIDAAQEPWAIYDAVRVMLSASPIEGAEEWAIHDYEGFGGVRIEEYASFDRVSELAAFLAVSARHCWTTTAATWPRRARRWKIDTLANTPALPTTCKTRPRNPRPFPIPCVTISTGRLWRGTPN